MTLSLAKGNNISLSRIDPKLNKLYVGLGWHIKKPPHAAFDLDASVFMLNKHGQVQKDEDFIFYNQLQSFNGAVTHLGDAQSLLTQQEDNEAILIDLPKVPQSIKKMVIAATIYDSFNRNQYFGQISNAYIRLLNADTGTELIRFDLPKDYSIETAMILGEIYRHRQVWKFRGVGQGFAGGLSILCEQYGVNI